MSSILCRRVYENLIQMDSYNILIDRLWPRGIKKENLKYDKWAKEIAPSPEIRKEFDHKKENFKNFKKSYIKELSINKESEKFLELVEEKLKKEDVILLYAAKDPECNHAIILKKWLEDNLIGRIKNRVYKGK